MRKRLLYTLTIILLTLGCNESFCQGKAAPKLDRQEELAQHLYQQGRYQEACDKYRAINKARRTEHDNRIVRGLLLFILFDIAGLFFFLYIEKRKAYKLLVDKNAEVARKPIINTFGINFETEGGEKHDCQLLAALQRALETDKAYLDCDLNINAMAAKLDISKAELSRLINQHLKCSFPTLIKQYRINEAVRLLTDSKSSQYKMEAIATLCGYSNRQVFHSVFKKETGLTPMEFKQVSQSKD